MRESGDDESKGGAEWDEDSEDGGEWDEGKWG